MPARRFDTALMAPPIPQPSVDAALLARVRTWCEAGAWPQLTQPWAAATPGPGRADPAALDGVACELDGSHALARLGRWRGLAWRVALQLRERRPGHRPRREDPWDCGWWRPGPLAVAAAFRPRRPTLLLVRAAEPAAIEALLATLARESPHYRCAVRVLVAEGMPALEAI